LFSFFIYCRQHHDSWKENNLSLYISVIKQTVGYWTLVFTQPLFYNYLFIRRYARCWWYLTLHIINVEKIVSRLLFHFCLPYLCMHYCHTVGLVRMEVVWVCFDVLFFISEFHFLLLLIFYLILACLYTFVLLVFSFMCLFQCLFVCLFISFVFPFITTIICWCCHSNSVNTGSRLPNISEIKTRKRRNMIGIDMIRNNSIECFLIL
jgi:hypothetical protein